ncbi:TRAP transporter large permease [Pararhodobacter oceanensis]|uniref:TRAP transporter large permease protein n=1 Tax=Pararhodobacter oceanensis TaxID=2172121 RepID=A0A2T8HT00_9RHOB|nr:TRAP transporter large permease subunit [Pararhodobacter oceanensis]PVH28541.1 C4-dicarboxylate ABC transporter [Pararhodobacter oceanensis]
MFPAVIAVLLLGYPVAFTLSGVAIGFAVFGWGFDIIDLALMNSVPSRIYGIMTNLVFVAIPLFVFMGVVLERSRIAEDLLLVLGALFGRMRGGLGLSVIFVGALMAASTGVVGASVVTMGLLSLPAMMRAGYDKKLAAGVICTSGTLGQIIPPSTVLILLADILQGANSQAQMAKGNFAPEPISVVELFAGAFIPGLMLVGLYALYMIYVAIFRGEKCPALEPEEDAAHLGRRVLKALLAPLALIGAVLGSILMGLATATEAAAIGAIGAVLLAALQGKLNLKLMREAMHSTLMMSSMIFLILIGASLFSLVFRMYDGDQLVEAFLHGMPGGVFSAMLFVMLVIFVLGFVLDFIEIMFLVLPIVAPIMLMFDISPIWFGIMIAVNLQTSFLTPPFGFSLFYLRSVAPPEIKTTDIYRGVIPFVGLQMLGLALLAGFPALATWLPAVLF